MFTLRVLESNGRETNFVLGNNYSLYLKHRHQKEMEDILTHKMESVKSEFNFTSENPILPSEELFDGGLYGFVVGEEQTALLWKKTQRYYIMLNGKTHDNVSYENVCDPSEEFCFTESLDGFKPTRQD